MARVKRYNSEIGQWEYCNTGGMPIKGIDYLTRADYDTMRADIDAYLERNKESVGVTVSGNQGAEDVYGASVRVVGEDGSVIEEKTWNGTELVFRLEAGTVYHVEVDASLQGFSNYKSETFTAIKGGARTVTADVYAEKVNVSVEGIDSGFTVTVKEEYTQVEYIESTGAQYIDTGIGLGCEVHADVQFILGTQRSLMGFSTKACRYFGINTEGYYDIGTQAENISSYSGLERRNIKVLFEEMGISLTAEEETISRTTTTAYEGTLQLLGGSSSSGLTSYPCSARMFGCQIYQGEQLVRDYTPVMNSSGVYGLYDKVNGVFYSSATSTGFTGKAMGDEGLPAGYSECEYVESDGTNYVDTGFTPNSNTRVVMDCLTTSSTSSSNRWILGSNTSATSARFELINIGSDNSIRFYHGTTNQTFSGVGLGRMNIDVSLSSASVNGVSITPTSSTFTGTNSMLLCAGQTTGEVYSGMPMKLYSCQIYDNDVLIRDYVPCCSNEGVFGLYDKVNGAFYASATSTGLTGLVKTDTFLTLTETSGSCLVPYGTVYSVSATAVDGYASPSSQTFTANIDSRNVVMVYEENLLGVFIEDTTGKLWTSDAWDGSVTANGVAVCSENCRFVMALGNANDGLADDWAGWGSVIGNVTTTTDTAVAGNDYNGRANTEAMLVYSTSYAAKYCNEFVFANGNTGYLGAGGEWLAVINNAVEINGILNKLGHSNMFSSYWTSTQYDSSYAYYAYIDGPGLGVRDKTDDVFTRAFTTLKRDTN